MFQVGEQQVQVPQGDSIAWVRNNKEASTVQVERSERGNAEIGGQKSGMGSHTEYCKLPECAQIQSYWSTLSRGNS